MKIHKGCGGWVEGETISFKCSNFPDYFSITAHLCIETFLLL